MEKSYDPWVSSKMDVRHRHSASTHSDKRLAIQPGTSLLEARLVPLPDTSSGDSDDIRANPDYEQRGSIAHLAVQGVGLRDQDPRHLRLMSLRAGVHPRCIPNLMMVDWTGKARDRCASRARHPSTLQYTEK